MRSDGPISADENQGAKFLTEIVFPSIKWVIEMVIIYSVSTGINKFIFTLNKKKKLKKKIIKKKENNKVHVILQSSLLNVGLNFFPPSLGVQLEL